MEGKITAFFFTTVHKCIALQPGWLDDNRSSKRKVAL